MTDQEIVTREAMHLPTDFFIKKRKQLAALMQENSLAVIYAGREVMKSLDENYEFYFNNNYYYLTGLTEPEGILALDNHDGAHATLFIRRPDYDKEKWFGRHISAEKAADISGIADVRYTDEFKNWFKENAKGKTIYTDDTLADHQKLALSGVDDDAVCGLLPLLSKLRLVKEPEEIELMREAIDITNEGIRTILSHMTPDQYEYQAEAIFEYTIYDRGAEEVAFETIAASGDNGPILHYMSNRDLLKANTMCLFDLGARFRGYCADISRTFPTDGHFSSDCRKLYNAVLTAQKAIIPHYKAGAKMRDVQQVSRDLLWEAIKNSGLAAKDATIDDYYYHGIGHSLGLDTHDLCESRALTLEPGMVITCEPGLYMKERDMGVRIEDDILITENGPEVLSKAIPKEIDEIEGLMRR